MLPTKCEVEWINISQLQTDIKEHLKAQSQVPNAPEILIEYEKAFNSLSQPADKKWSQTQYLNKILKLLESEKYLRCAKYEDIEQGDNIEKIYKTDKADAIFMHLLERGYIEKIKKNYCKAQVQDLKEDAPNE